MKKEIPWINTLKFLCIVFIFLHHSFVYCGYEFSKVMFYYLPYFTNAFFFVSGYLLFKKQLSHPLIVYKSHAWYKESGGGKSLLSNIIFRIAIPSVVFSTLIYFPKRILRGYGIDAISFFHDTLLGGSMWFTCALTVAEIILFLALLSRLKNIWGYVLLGAIMVVIANYLTASGLLFMGSNKLPWQYKSGFIACLFLAFGGLYWKYEHNFDIFANKTAHSKAYFITISLGITWVVLTTLLIFIGKTDILAQMCQQLTRGTINIPSIIWAMLTSLIVIYLCRLYKGNRLTNWVGRNSIAFYFFCGAIPNVFSIICAKMLPQFEGARMVLIVWALSLACAFGVVCLFSRYLPWAFDFRKIKNK